MLSGEGVSKACIAFSPMYKAFLYPVRYMMYLALTEAAIASSMAIRESNILERLGLIATPKRS